MKPRYVWAIVLATILVGMFAGGTALAAGGIMEWTLTGTPHNDTLRGTDQHDAINAKGGDDTVHGLSGPDYPFGARGADKLFGDRGSDYVVGGKGKDVLHGGAGNDWLDGTLDGGQRDKLFCGKGFDRYSADKNDYVSPSCEKKDVVGGA